MRWFIEKDKAVLLLAVMDKNKQHLQYYLCVASEGSYGVRAWQPGYEASTLCKWGERLGGTLKSNQARALWSVRKVINKARARNSATSLKLVRVG